MNKNTKKQVNKKLYSLYSGRYFEAIPLDQIFGILKDVDYTPLQEDGRPWDGLLCGTEGQVYFDLGHSENLKLDKSALLAMSWYKMPSGRYEIISYVS